MADETPDLRPDLVNRPDGDESLLRRFAGVIVLAIVLGAAIALGADSSYFDGGRPFTDAAREIGGAIVAGGVLAALVVWFEDRREGQRVDREIAWDERRFQREEEREDQVARRAWRREIDVRLYTVVLTDLTTRRHEVLDDLEAESRQRTSPVVSPVLRGGSRPMRHIVAEVESLILFLREEELGFSWSEWCEAYDHLLDVPEPQESLDAAGDDTEEPPVAPIERLGWRASVVTTDFAIGPSRDPALHAEAVAQESRRWEEFNRELQVYIERNYPTG